MYIVYLTPWSEGEVVAHISDKSFTVGVDHTTGSSLKVNSIQELLQTQDLYLTTTSNMSVAVRRDTAWYPRDPSDPVEYEKFQALWKQEWSYEPQP